MTITMTSITDVTQINWTITLQSIYLRINMYWARVLIYTVTMLFKDCYTIVVCRIL